MHATEPNIPKIVLIIRNTAEILNNKAQYLNYSCPYYIKLKYRLQRGALYEEEKKKPAFISVIAVIALLSSLLSACNNAETVESNPRYLADVSQYTF